MKNWKMEGPDALFKALVEFHSERAKEETDGNFHAAAARLCARGMLNCECVTAQLRTLKAIQSLVENLSESWEP